LRVVDSVDFAAEHILPRVIVAEKLSSVVVHPTCSSTRSGSNENLMSIARAFADEAIVPDAWGCCGFAGDRGFNFPELNAHALRDLRGAVAGCSAGYSSNRTCEIGLSQHGGLHYRSIVYVVEQQAKGRSSP